MNLNNIRSWKWYYTLDENKNPVPCDDLIKWATWMEGPLNNLSVGHTVFRDFYVSTVFLGLDHTFGQRPEPTLFETMIFYNDGTPTVKRRYSTWAEAEAGHKETCETMFERQLNAEKRTGNPPRTS